MELVYLLTTSVILPVPSSTKPAKKSHPRFFAYNRCGSAYAKEKSGSTSNMLRHHLKCAKEAGQSHEDQLNPEQLRNLLVQWIVSNDIPFSVVDVLGDFGLLSRLLAVSCDNASNMTCMLKILEDNHQQLLSHFSAAVGCSMFCPHRASSCDMCLWGPQGRHDRQSYCEGSIVKNIRASPQRRERFLRQVFWCDQQLSLFSYFIV